MDVGCLTYKKMKKIIVMLLMISLLVFSIGFAEAKKTEEKVTFDGKGVKDYKLLEKYKPIKIKNDADVTLLDGYLSSHDEYCGNDCTSIAELKTYKKSPLIDSILFKTLQKDGSWIIEDVKSYSLYYWGNLDVVGEVCSETKDGERGNKSKITWCREEVIGTIGGWVEFYEGDIFDIGEYKVKIEADKIASKTVDWIITSQGESIDEWATWVPYVYDEIDDSSINATLWTTSVSSSGSSTGTLTENSDNMHIDLKGQGAIAQGSITSKLLNDEYSQNITTRITLSVNSDPHGYTVWARARFYMFGNLIKEISDTDGGPAVSDASVWTFKKNGTNWDVYDDGVYQNQITPTTDTMVVNAYADDDHGYSQLADAYIYYVHGYEEEEVWNNQSEIRITENSGVTLDNYSVLVYVEYEDEMNSDFSDLRFYNEAEDTELGYWIQNKSDDNYAYIWVDIPTLTASSETTIYMNYGNVRASSTSSKDNVFLDADVENFGNVWDQNDVAVNNKFGSWIYPNVNLLLLSFGHGTTTAPSTGYVYGNVSSSYANADNVDAESLIVQVTMANDEADVGAIAFDAGELFIINTDSQGSTYMGQYDHTDIVNPSGTNGYQISGTWGGAYITGTRVNLEWMETDARATTEPSVVFFVPTILPNEILTSFFGYPTEAEIIFSSPVYRSLLINKYANILNATIDVTGSPTSSICYQEDTNRTNQTGIDGDCSLNYSGNWERSGTTVSLAVIDGVWGNPPMSGDGTSPFEQRYIYLNYTKPDGAIGGTWEMMFRNNTAGITRLNMTIPSNCWGQYDDIVQLRLWSKGYPYGVDASCWDGSWDSLFSHPGYNNIINTYIYEEAMWWEILGDYPTNVSLEIGGVNVWNYSGKFNDTTTVNNFSSVLNDALNDGACDCTGCELSGDNDCIVNFTFDSDTPGILEYNLSVEYPVISITNDTTGLNLSGGTSYWEEGADLTFVSSNPLTSWFSWTVGGVIELAGYGENVFTWVFNLPSDAPNETVRLETTLNNITETEELTIITNSENPLVQITYPVDGATYEQTDTVGTLNYTSSDAGFSNCWYNINDGENVSTTCGNNFTNITLSGNGVYTITLYANDTMGNVNQSSSSFTYLRLAHNPQNEVFQCGAIIADGTYTINESLSGVDCLASTAENVNLIFQSENSNATLFLDNSTVLSGDLSFGTNIQLGYGHAYINSTALPSLNRAANITFNKDNTSYLLPTVMRDGLICTDCTSYSDLNSGTATFSVAGFSNYTIGDEPSVELLYPAIGSSHNSSRDSINILFNVTDSNLDSCWYDSYGTNYSTTCNANFSYFVQGGDNSIIYYANDTDGNENSSTLTISGGIFVMEISNSTTTVEITNDSTTWEEGASLTLNSSAPITSWFSWTVGGVLGLAGWGENIFTWAFDLPSGSPNATVTLNTTANVSGATTLSQEFEIVTNSLNPVVDIIAPEDNTEAEGTIILNWTIDDTNLESCWYNIGGENITINNTSETEEERTVYSENWTTLGDADYTSTFYPISGNWTYVRVGAGAKSGGKQLSSTLSNNLGDTARDTYVYANWINGGSQSSTRDMTNYESIEFRYTQYNLGSSVSGYVDWLTAAGTVLSSTQILSTSDGHFSTWRIFNETKPAGATKVQIRTANSISSPGAGPYFDYLDVTEPAHQEILRQGFEDGIDYLATSGQVKAPTGWSITSGTYGGLFSGATTTGQGGLVPVSGTYLYTMWMFSGMGTTGWIEKDFTENIDGETISFDFASEVSGAASAGTMKIQFFGSSSLISEQLIPLSQLNWSNYNYTIPNGTDNIRFWTNNANSGRGTQMYLDNIIIGAAPESEVSPGTGVGSCSIDYISLDLIKGIYDITIWGNDTVSNEGFSTVSNISIGYGIPQIQIDYPINGASYVQPEDIANLSYTFSDESSSTCKYNINGGTNTTVNCTSEITYPTIDASGTYTITLFAEDGYGNVNSSTVTFSHTHLAHDGSNVIYQCGDIITSGDYTMNNTVGSNSNVSEINGLISHYDLNEASGSVLDLHGNNNGTNSGATPNVAGKLGTAYDFDLANSDHITMGDVAAFEILYDGNFSGSAWINPDTVVGNNQIFSKYDVGVSEGWQMRIIQNGKINFDIDSGTDRYQVTTTDIVLSTGSWQFVSFAYSAGDVVIYVDGVSVPITILEDSLASYTNDAGDFNIGGRDGTNEFFDGLIDEVSIFNEALTTVQFLEMYSEELAYNTSNDSVISGIDCLNSSANDVNLIFYGENSNVTFFLTDTDVLSGDFTAGVYINITNDSASIDSVSLPALDRVANVTLSKGVTSYVLQSIMRDGIPCTDCTQYTSDLNDAVTTFAVTGFSNYTIGDEPSLVLTYPTDGSAYNSSWSEIDILFTSVDTNLDSCWYNTGAANSSITCNTNISYLIQDGTNLITYYVNDTGGNSNSSTLTILGGEFITVVANDTTSVVIVNGSITYWEEGANLTFNSSSPITSWFSWTVGGVLGLAGWGENVFTWVFDLTVDDPSALVRLETLNDASSNSFNNSLTSENLTSSIICYQEFANVSNTCGGLDSGSYSGAVSDVLLSIDGDYDTQSGWDWEETKTLYINYSKPEGATQDSVWQVKDLSGTANITIPETCFNHYEDHIYLTVVVGGYTDYYCSGRSGNLKLRETAFSNTIGLYEEGMWWNVIPTNNTRYLAVPENASIFPSYLDIAGNLYLNGGDGGIVEEESSDSYVATGWYDAGNAVDGDWNTFAYRTSPATIYFVENWTIPDWADGASLKFKIYVQSSTSSRLWSSATCWDYDTSSWDTLISMSSGISAQNFTVVIPEGCYNGDTLQTRISRSSSGTMVNYLYETLLIFSNGTKAENPYLQVGNTQVWNYTGEFDTTETTPDFSSAITEYISTASPVSGEYLVPFIFHTDVPGNLGYSNINLSYGEVASNQEFEIVTDSVAPELNLTYPVSQTNYEGDQVLEFSLNWTASDENLRTCWYNIGGANVSISDNCIQTSATINITIGYYDITLYINDSAGNVVSSTATNVSINNEAPVVTATTGLVDNTGLFIHEKDIYYLNWTVSDDSLDSCWHDYYNNNSGIFSNIVGVDFLFDGDTTNAALSIGTFSVKSYIQSLKLTKYHPSPSCAGPGWTETIANLSTCAIVDDKIDFNITNNAISETWELSCGATVLFSSWYGGFSTCGRVHPSEITATDTPLDCSANTTTFYYTFGEDEITFYANDTSGNIASSVEAIHTGAFFHNESHEAIVSDTDASEYNITFTTAETISSVTLNSYGGNKVGTLVAQDGTMYTYTATQRQQDGFAGNRSFLWILVTADDTYASNTYYQTVEDINLYRCEGDPNAFITFNFYDENSLDPINASTNEGLFSYSEGGELSELKILQDIDLTEVETVSYCYNNTEESIYTEVNFKYSANDVLVYPLRTHSATYQLSNVTTIVDLYALEDVDGIYTTVIVNDVYTNPLANSHVIWSRNIAGDMVIVGEDDTDDSGSATFWVNPNYPHTLEVTNEQYECTGETSSITPSQSSYLVQLVCSAGGGATYDYRSPLEGVSWEKRPAVGVIEPQVDLLFEFKIRSQVYNMTAVKFEIVDFETRAILASINASVLEGSDCEIDECLLQMNHTVVNEDNLLGRYYVQMEGSSFYTLLEADGQWKVIEISNRSGTVMDLFRNLNDYFGETKNEDGQSIEQRKLEFSKILLVFLFIAIGLAFFGRMTGYEAANPGFFSLFLTGILVIVSIPGFLTITNASFGVGNAFFDQYVIAFISGMLSLGLMASIWRRGTQ